MMRDMMDMMKECCGEDGMPEFDKMKTFMAKCGKTEFTEGELKMMQQFCDSSGKPDAEKMKQFMENCGC